MFVPSPSTQASFTSIAGTERITRERDQEAVAMRRALLITAASTVATTSTVAFNVNLYVKTASVGAISGSSSPFLAASGPRRSTRTRTRTAGSLYNSRNGGVEGLYQWTGKQGGRRRSLARREGVSMQASSEASVDTPDVETEENVNKDRVWNKCTDRVELGTSGLMVSRIGFGGIMIGGQMGEEQTHTVLNHAFDKAGINWLDTSESYPHPLIPQHKHKADPIVGSWLKGRDRSKVILCTKVAGRHNRVNWLRKDGSTPSLSRDHMLESVEGSLERMGTDYIDMLYLGDWPDRYLINPGQYYYQTSDEHELALDLEGQLKVVQELKDQGVVRHVAVANETPFGVTKCCEHATWDGLPKIACVQMEYNILTQHKVEMDLTEACAPRQENVSIVATQTLGGGALSTKYMWDRNLWDRDPNYRLNMWSGFQGRYNSPRIHEKIDQYKAIAAKYDLSIHQLSMAYVHNKPFITAALMGATNIEQIDQNVGALDIVIPEECMKEIVSLQDSYLEPMLGASEATPMKEYYKSNTGEFGGLDDENTKFKTRVFPGYPGP